MSTLQQVKKITAVYQNDLPKRLPFHQHPLKQEDMYTKELYCTMLAVIIQCEHTPETEQAIFLKRLVAGVDSDMTFEQYMQKALTITEQFPKDFYDQLYGHEIFKNFIVDALVMMNCKEKMNKNQFAFLADLLAVFQISEERLHEWVTFAKNILTQNKEAILQYVASHADFENLRLFAYYDVDHQHRYYLKNGDIQQIDAIMNEGAEVLLFEDCHFTRELLSYNIHSKKLVHFKNCRFEAIPASLQFLNIHALIFEGCEFSNFSDTSMLVDDVHELIVKRCIVRNMEQSNNERAIFIGGGDVERVMIVESQFINLKNDYGSSWDYNHGILMRLQTSKLHLIGNLFKEVNAKTTSTLFCEYMYQNYVCNISYEEDIDTSLFVTKRTLESYVSDYLRLGQNQNICADNEIIECTNLEAIEG